MTRLDAAGWAIDLCPLAVETAGGQPNPMPAELMVIQRTGGAAPNRISDRPILAVECYARTKTRAFAIAADASDWLLNLSGRHAGVIVYEVSEIGGPADLPDPRAPQHYRVTFAVELHLRATRRP